MVNEVPEKKVSDNSLIPPIVDLARKQLLTFKIPKRFMAAKGMRIIRAIVDIQVILQTVIKDKTRSLT